MSDSRYRGGMTNGDLGGGRESGRPRRAGAFARDRWGVRPLAVAAMAVIGMLRVAGWAGAQQAPAAPAQEAPAAPAQEAPAAPAQEAPATGSAQPLSVKYRFAESYGLKYDAGRPDRLVQYQVGSIETIRTESEKARGAPDRTEIEYRTIYTEQAAQVGRLGEVTDAVRRYDSFRAGGAAQGLPQMANLLKGLKLWYHPRAGALPELISLTPQRLIRQLEYETALAQIFFPRLPTIFPPRPVRVADTWIITRAAAQALLGPVQAIGDFELEATLSQVEKAAKGTELTAIIDISGLLNLEQGEGAVRARLSFVFEPIPMASPSARTATGAAPRDSEVVDARGYISKVNMSRRLSTPRDEDGRLQEIGTRELLLQRRKVPPEAAEADSLVPEKPPVADEHNSWLLYDDLLGRFHLRHPQELKIEIDEPDALVLNQERPDGKSSTVILGAVPKEADSVRDRKWSDPQVFVREVQQNAARLGGELVNGEMGWLPEQEWTPLKRRVYRYEAAVKRENSLRHYQDDYLILFASGDHFRVQALTNRDDHLVFRNQTEELIRSIELGPSDPAMAPRAGQPAPARPSGTGVPSGRPSAKASSSGRPSATGRSSGRPAAPPVPRPERYP